MKHRFILILAGTLLCSCGGAEQPRPATLLPTGFTPQPGDIVLRRGSGMASRAVLLADRGGRYSHAGLVVDSAGVPMVIHAVPGEPDFPGDVDRVKLETPAQFFSPARAECGAVLRPRSPLAGRRAARAAWAVYRRGTRFDHSYDDADTLRMYCTELVLHAYRRADAPLNAAPARRVGLFGHEWHCHLPSDLARSPSLRTILTF